MKQAGHENAASVRTDGAGVWVHLMLQARHRRDEAAGDVSHLRVSCQVAVSDVNWSPAQSRRLKAQTTWYSGTDR